jgi:predicted acyl esterase
MNISRPYLVIGPYDHGGAQSVPSPVLRGYTIDSVANMSITNLAYDWFNYILKDSAKPALLKNYINYQVMGTNEWKHAPSLSKMNNDTIKFYLSTVRISQHYKLSAEPPAATEFIRQEVDFTDRSDSIQSGSRFLVDSSLDVTNGLSFISAPFKKPIEINGSFTGKLDASINKKDMDVSIELYELLPNGKFFSLDNWLGRCSYARDRNKRQLLEPGKKETIPVAQSFFISKRINAGSKLVVVLKINKNPYWQINYGTGKDVSDETIADAKEPLQIKWYNSSVIKIPVFK